MKNVKILMFAVLFIFLGVQMKAQEDTEPRYLLGNQSGKVYVSGFGAYTIGFSQVDGSFAVYNGGGGAVLLNQTFYIGAYGTGLSTSHKRDEITVENEYGESNTYYNLNTLFGHGGFWLGYLHKSYKPVHFGVSSKLGWGSLSLANNSYSYEPEYTYYSLVSDHVFVITPQVEVELNLLKWFKINAGVGYQFVTGVDKTYTNGDNQTVKFFDSKDFNQPILNLSFVFGGFGGKR